MDRAREDRFMGGSREWCVEDYHGRVAGGRKVRQQACETPARLAGLRPGTRFMDELKIMVGDELIMGKVSTVNGVR